MQAKAAVLYTLGQPLIIDTVEFPAPAAGQVAVKVAFSGVCLSQLMEARGKRGEDRYLPHLLGHEGSGTVIAIGDGVTKVKVGDRVVLGWIKGSGMDVPGPKVNKDGQIINAGAVTTFSSHTIVSENRCVKLPEGIPMDLAVLFGCAILTGAGIACNQVKPVPGSSVGVFGLGGIGLSALLALALFDCSMVVAVDIEDAKLQLARECGATHTINGNRGDIAREISRLTCGKGLDYAIEASGSTASIETAFEAVRKSGGLCVFASHPPAGEKISLNPHDLISGKRIEGSWGGGCNPDLDIPKFADFYLAGKLPLQRLLGKRYPLEEINHALDDLEQRKITRALITMT
jgi:S-(hydroxymethyl)glutathione dehydrogenase / alcohol dehydrogenase